MVEEFKTCHPQYEDNSSWDVPTMTPRTVKGSLEELTDQLDQETSCVSRVQHKKR